MLSEAVNQRARKLLSGVAREVERDQQGESGSGKILSQDARWRSAISRAYYAAYASVSGALHGNAIFPAGRFGPSHDKLPKLIMANLRGMEFFERANVVKAARRLYRQRIAADYEPLQQVGLMEARIAVRDAGFILRSIANAQS